MEISIRITVPLFGLQLKAEIDGEYTHDTFEPSAVYLWQVTEPEAGRLTYIHTFLPTPADVSDFYSAHAEAIDAAVLDTITAESDDLYERAKQDETDDAAERLRA